VVSLATIGFDGYLSFIDPNSIKVAESLSPFSPIPFPSDFVSWIQSHDLFQVVNTQAVVVSGFNGIQIDGDATQVCGTKKTGSFSPARAFWSTLPFYPHG
jgi:hypothetical protein